MDRKNWIKKRSRIKNKLKNSGNIFRLVIFRSNKHIYGQVLDYSKGITLFSSSSNDSSLRKEVKSSNKLMASKIVAKDLSQKMKKNKINSITFDRNGYLYHGRIKAFAEELRENGIKF